MPPSLGCHPKDATGSPGLSHATLESHPCSSPSCIALLTWCCRSPKGQLSPKPLGSSPCSPDQHGPQGAGTPQSSARDEKALQALTHIPQTQGEVFSAPSPCR